MSQSNETTAEIRRIRRLLKQMYRLSEHSSLTGALSEGATDAVTQYNLILVRLEELGVLSKTLFPPLPQDASFDRLGVVSKLLEGYVEEEEPASESSGTGHNIVIGNISGLEDLKDVGRLVRENLPEFLRRRPAAGAESGAAAAAAEIEDPEETAPTIRRESETPQDEMPLPMPNLSRQ